MRLGIKLFLIIGLLVCPLLGFSQTIADELEVKDTVKPHDFRLEVNLLFMLSDEEMNKQPSIDLINTIYANYVFRQSDLDFTFRQNISWDSDGDKDRNNLFVLYAGLSKYRKIAQKKLTLQHFYPEPIFLYQNYSSRGLEHRYQAGLLIHPWRFHRPNFKIDIGIGAVYDWSTWRVNDAEKIAASSPDLQEKIAFINSHTELKDNMFQLHSEWRPMIHLKMIYNINDIYSLRLSTAFQQSLISPYNKEIQDKYPDLSKVYPYILSGLQFSIKLHKNLALSFTFEMDYENSNVALYDSSWAYNMLLGLSWSFTK